MATLISCSNYIFVAFLGFLAVTAATQGNGRFSVVYAPKYVKFLQSANALNTEEIPSVILSTLGLPLSKDITWNGLSEGNPFRRPKANVLFSVLEDPGTVESFQPKTTQRTYPTRKADGFLDTDDVIAQIQMENWREEPLYLDFSSSAMMPTVRSSAAAEALLSAAVPSSYHSLHDRPLSPWFTPQRLGALNVAGEADLLLLGELQTILGIISALETDPTVLRFHAPDFLHFSLTGLQAVLSHYGQSSPQALSARQITNEFINEVTDRVRGLYRDAAVVEVVTVLPPSEEANLVRKTRSLLADASTSNKTLNLAPAFTYMYAPIFNIILWVMIALSLAVFGISWGMWNMDPGRDSLIYRMTSQRMKRD